MPDNDLTLRIGADAAGVDAGAADVKEQVAGIDVAIQGLTDEFKALGAEAIGAFEAVSAGAKAAATSVKETAEAIGAVQKMLAGVGEAILAAFAVEAVTEFSKQMAETAEQTFHTAETFGTTTAEIQRLKAEAAGLGIPFEAFTMAMQRSDRALTTAREGGKQAGVAFKALGIDINDQIGQVDLFNQEIAGLSKIEDVPTRIGIAMQLFGRNIQNIAPLISVTKEQLADLNATMDAYGVKNDDAEKKGLALAEAFNVNKIAMQGLGSTLTQALAPALTEIVKGINGLIKGMIDSYQHAGLMKGVLDATAITLKVVAEALVLTWIAAEKLVAPLVYLYHEFEALWESILGRGQQADVQAKLAFETMAASARDAANAVAFLNQMWSTTAALPALPKAAPGGADLLNLKPKKAAKPEDQMGEWTEELKRKELDLESFTGEFNADMSGLEIAFWESKLSTAKTGSDRYYEIMAQLEPLLRTQQSDEIKLAQQGEKAREEELKKALAAHIKIIDEETKATIKGAQDQLAAQSAAVAEHISVMKEALAAGQITRAQESAAIDNDLRSQGQAKQDAARTEYLANAEKLNAMIADEQAMGNDISGLLQQRIGAWTNYENARAKINSDTNKAINDNDKIAAAEFKKSWDGVVNPLVSSFTSGLLQMAEGTKTFAQLMASIGQQILNDFITNVVDRKVEAWLWGEVSQTGATNAQSLMRKSIQGIESMFGIATSKTTAAADITASAAQAFAAAFAATAAIPIIGPALAPGVAAASYGGAMGGLGLLAAEGGFDVGNFAPLTQLHPYEMVLPARLANPMRDMMGSFQAANFNGFGGSNDSGGSGDTHLHLHMGAGADGPSLQRWFNDHGDKLVTSLNSRLRGGAKLATG